MRRLTWLSAVVAALVFVLHTLGALGTLPWDDALFFKRFAVNTIDHGVAAWNVDDGPIHGNTTQLMQLVATAVVAVAPDHYLDGIRLLLGAALLATFLILAATVRRLVPGECAVDERGPHAVLLCGLTAPAVFMLIGSGMETTLALCALALFLYLLARIDQRALGPAWMETAAFAAGHVLVYLARPDMIILAGVISAIVIYEPGAPPLRQVRLVRLGVAALAGVALLLLALRAYYGTAFPLSFYLKNHYLSFFDSESRALDSLVKNRHLVTWLLMAAPFLFVALHRRDRWNLALVAGAAAMVGYHYVATVEIMGFHARFHVPALLAVVLAAALAWPNFATASWRAVLPFAIAYPLACVWAYSQQLLEPHKGDFYLSRVRPEYYVWFAAAAVLLVLAPLLPRARVLAVGVLVPLTILAGAAHASSHRSWRLRDDKAIVAGMARRLNAMRGATDVKACLPEPLHIYHSEIGVTGLMFLDSHITDLSGLMNRAMVFDRTPFDESCLAAPPEVLFLPHEGYKRLNREVKRSRCLREFARPRHIRRSHSTLYIRRDLLADFDRCTAARRDPASK